MVIDGYGEVGVFVGAVQSVDLGVMGGMREGDEGGFDKRES
jgi:hypothetical protein